MDLRADVQEDVKEKSTVDINSLFVQLEAVMDLYMSAGSPSNLQYPLELEALRAIYSYQAAEELKKRMAAHGVLSRFTGQIGQAQKHFNLSLFEAIWDENGIKILRSDARTSMNRIVRELDKHSSDRTDFKEMAEEIISDICTKIRKRYFIPEVKQDYPKLNEEEIFVEPFTSAEARKALGIIEEKSKQFDLPVLKKFVLEIFGNPGSYPEIYNRMAGEEALFIQLQDAFRTINKIEKLKEYLEKSLIEAGREEITEVTEDTLELTPELTVAPEFEQEPEPVVTPEPEPVVEQTPEPPVEEIEAASEKIPQTQKTPVLPAQPAPEILPPPPREALRPPALQDQMPSLALPELRTLAMSYVFGSISPGEIIRRMKKSFPKTVWTKENIKLPEELIGKVRLILLSKKSNRLGLVDKLLSEYFEQLEDQPTPASQSLETLAEALPAKKIREEREAKPRVAKKTLPVAEPAADLAVEPEPTSEPEPASEPDPVSEPEPVSEPKPDSDAAPSSEPEPISDPEPVSDSDLASDSERAPASERRAKPRYDSDRPLPPREEPVISEPPALCEEIDSDDDDKINFEPEEEDYSEARHEELDLKRLAETDIDFDDGNEVVDLDAAAADDEIEGGNGEGNGKAKFLARGVKRVGRPKKNAVPSRAVVFAPKKAEPKIPTRPDREVPPDPSIKIKIGEVFTYPGRALMEVIKFVEKDLNGRMELCCVVRNLMDNKETIFVPIRDGKAENLRPLMKKSEVDDLFEILREKVPGNAVHEATWNRRYRAFSDKMKSGSPFDLAEIVRDMMYVSQNKGLSFGEREMLRRAEAILYKIIEAALKITEEEVRRKVFALLGEEGPVFPHKVARDGKDDDELEEALD